MKPRTTSRDKASNNLRKSENKKKREKKKQSSDDHKRRERKNKGKGSMAVVQELYQTCKEVFATGEAGYVPPPPDIDRLRAVLDRMNLEEAGLSSSMPYFQATGSEGAPPPITYIHIYECHNFSTGIFCLPPRAVIPLHNHPGMTGFSKLLFGAMHCKSYDWVNNQNSNGVRHPPEPGLRLARVHADSDFTAPCTAAVLYPAAGGNMHCFTALTSCAILHVHGPPYSDADGRPCTYFQEIPYPSLTAGEMPTIPTADDGEYAWLKEREKPEDFVVVGQLYTGPLIVES